MKNYLISLKSSLVALSCAGLISCSGTQAVLLDGVEQSTANNIILQLGQNDIKASKQLEKNGTYSIRVRTGEQIRALEILRNSGQPVQKYATLGEVFKKDGFISSPIEEQGRLIYALQEQISGMIAQFDGVTSVSTQVSLPPPADNLWQSEVVRPAASVFIKYQAGYHLEMYSNRIKQLVANSVPGLTPDRVEVVLMVQKN